jgi:ATP-dependent DNA helicase RecG
MAELGTDVRYIKGIGEKKALALKKLDVLTLYDLVSFFPRRYEDRSVYKPIALTLPEETVCIRAMVADEPRLARVRRGLDMVKFRVVDDSGSVDITYFNQSYIKDNIKKGETYVFYGKVAAAGSRRTMANPVYEREGAPGGVTGRIVPIYRLTAGLSQRVMMQAVRQGLDECGSSLPEVLPDSILVKYNLCQAGYAYENIHFPADFGALELARRRLIFEELFTLACAMGRLRKRGSEKSGIKTKKADFEEFYRTLPFSPTGAQRRAVEQAAADMCSGRPMSRLIQGDVGSGKTLVAAALVWYMKKNGCMSAFMAPTEILAEQHLRTFTSLLAPFGMTVGLLKGSMTAKEKREVKKRLAGGELDLVIGTHALLTDDVELPSLGLVITDEQHRFGVEQRAALVSKGESPHVLVMSATPIPRTLALIIYGDLDVSVIDEMPPGRQKVDTFAVDESYRRRLYAFIEKQAFEGRQTFVVCPMIDENDELPQGVKSAKEHTEELKKFLPRLRVECIHGKMKAREKEAVMNAFVNGDIDVLVSTTVIEVGVDVPNASLMVIENADRFGLSQLHQLRGRVGRGQYKSYCILVSDADGEDAKARLKVMTQTSDGFKISEEDLKLRGPGDFFGSRQHGLPEMHIADLCSDMNVLQTAQDAARELLSSDPELTAPGHEKLRAQVDRLFEQNSGTLN